MPDNEISENQINTRQIKEQTPTWLIALLAPAAALASAYAYWVGFLGVFGIPQEMITVQASDALIAFAVVVFVLIIFNGLLSVIHPIVISLPWWIKGPVAFLYPVLLLGGLIGLALRNSRYWLVFAIAFFALLLLIYLTPLIFQFKTKGYTQKLRKDLERIRTNLSSGEMFGPNPISFFSRKYPNTSSLVLITAIIIGLAYTAGIGVASSKSTFMVNKDNHSQVLIAIVADRAFLKTANGDDSESIEVLPANSLPAMIPITMTFEQLKIIKK
ncbi:MAG: hypothetical protein ACYDDR_10900 [Acidithiobacillus ferrivorans]